MQLRLNSQRRQGESLVALTGIEGSNHRFRVYQAP